MEIQLFLFNKHDYNGFQDALLNNDGVIGLSFLVTENTNGKENSHWKPIFDKIDTIRRAGNVEKIEPIGIQELLPELKDLKQYWMYQGSLTTPPCSNTLKWIVSKDFVKMQQSQVVIHIILFSYIILVSATIQKLQKDIVCIISFHWQLVILLLKKEIGIVFNFFRLNL